MDTPTENIFLNRSIKALHSLIVNIEECIEELKEWTTRMGYEMTMLEYELAQKENNKEHHHEIIDLTEETDED